MSAQHKIDQVLQKTDISSALQNFRDLNVEAEQFTFPDNKKRLAMALNGTIPVHYKGNCYNIPVSVYLWETHPYYAPICYVKPTETMVIRESEHVNSSGRIFLPYLKEWRFPGYDLNGLLQVMAMVFQEKCPVFAKQNTAQTPSSAVSSNISYSPAMSSSVSTSSPYPAYASPFPVSTPYPTNTPPYPTGSASSHPTPPPRLLPLQLTPQNDQFKQSLVTALQETFRSRLEERLGELVSIFQAREELEAKQRNLSLVVDQMEAQMADFQEFITAANKRKGELEEQVATLGTAQAQPAVDEIIVARSPLYRQLVDNYALDLACDDAVYVLGKALQNHTLPPSDYIKQVIRPNAWRIRQVRNVYRKQFISRAIAQKCRQEAGLSL